MRYILSLALVFPLAVAGCATKALGQQGPGVDSESACNEVPPPVANPGTTAQATAEGGQRASNNPQQTDPGARGLHTVWNRGSGPNSDASQTTETRSQAGAPSVNQGLILPTSAEVGGGSAGVVGAKDVLRAALDAYRLKVAAGADSSVEWKQVLDAQAALAAAEQGARPVVNYNLQGATSTQTVANGSQSGGGDSSLSVPASRSPAAPKAPGAPPVVEPAGGK